MPQGPFAVAPVLKPTTGGANINTYAQADLAGTLVVGKGQTTALNITSNTVLKATPGRIGVVSVLISGSSVGGIYDAVAISGATTATQLAVIPEAIGVYPIDLPTANGIVISAGTGQTLAVSFI